MPLIVLPAGADADSGWTRDAGVVRLTAIADQVGMGTLTPVAGVKYEAVLDDAVNNAVSDVGVLTHTTSGVAAANIGAGLLFRAEGTGGIENVAAVRAVLLDVGALTTAGALHFYTRNGGTFTGRWEVGAAGAFTPLADASYGIGSSDLRVSGFYADSLGFNVYLGVGAVNPGYSVTSSGLRGGAGGGATQDVRLARSAVNTWTIDNGAGGAAVLSVLGTTVTQGRRVGGISKTFATAPSGTPYAVASTIETVFVDTSGGNCGVQVPDAALAAQLGRRITLKKTTLDANTITVSSAGGSVEGLSPYVMPGLLRGSITVESDGANWWIVMAFAS